MKVAFFNGINNKADSIRGIGVHTNELLKQLEFLIINSQFSIINNQKRADVIHFTKFRPFFRDLPLFKSRGPACRQARQKWILTIHDLIPLIYPKIYKPGIRGKINFLINKYLIKKNVDQIITISETSKKDIIRFLNVDPKKVHVIYLAPKDIYKRTAYSVQRKVKTKYNLPERFALYTGDINYNKNIPNLIKACRLAKIPLVIAGKQAKEVENMDLTHSETSHLAGVSFDDVIRLGFVDDKTLVDLYNLATVYIQPSLYEGFGLPVLEAIVCGTPIVATKTQALVEILGNNIDYVDPNNPQDMARGIANPNKNIKLPRVYSWQKTAKETLEVYAKA